VPDASHPQSGSRTAQKRFPATHSLLSPDALARHVEGAYDIGAVRSCSLLQHNLNDTYQVDGEFGRYILRVSQARRVIGRGWRTREEILFELDVLRHLASKGVPVAAPVARRDGTTICEVHAPEGLRQLVLFTYARGEPVSPSKQTEALARCYGQAVAALHTATDDFTSVHPRFALDLDFLLEQPLSLLEPYLAQRPADWHELRTLATALAGRLARLREHGLGRGVCHGDAQGGNAHMAADGTITFFDFDLCALGWRAYDVAVFCWGAALGRVRLGWDEQTVRRLCVAYLSGYEERRPLSPAEHEAIASLVLVRHSWYLGLEAGHWDTWGITDARRDAFFDRELAFVRAWAAEHDLLS
jgi:Ser/Thr protein kinase RdoA (MazF antagonist)